MKEDLSGLEFGKLPSEGFVSRKKVLEIFPFSKMTLDRRIKDGSFPSPKKIGKTIVWPVEVIRALIFNMEQE